MPANVSQLLTCDTVSNSTCGMLATDFSEYAEFQKVCVLNHGEDDTSYITCQSWCDANGDRACKYECPGKFDT